MLLMIYTALEIFAKIKSSPPLLKSLLLHTLKGNSSAVRYKHLVGTWSLSTIPNNSSPANGFATVFL